MFPPGYYQSMEVEENGWSNLGAISSRKPKNKKKNHPETNWYIFSKKSHPKQISYTFSKVFLYRDQFFYTYIQEKLFLYSSSRRFLYRSRSY